jgi:hypothetical protein
MFKIQMGLAGVGTPDATYAVSCYPANSTALNPNSDQPLDTQQEEATDTLATQQPHLGP